MIPELGHFALILAGVVAAVLGTLPLAGAATGRPAWMALARPAADAMGLLVAVAFTCLAASFLRCDFSVAVVAANANTALPAAYRLAAVWGGHEGSLLLWLLILCGWTVAVAHASRSLPQDMAARVLGVLGLVAAGFCLFLVATSDPFARLLPAPPQGRDLNPLLQDPGMVLHPPLLYMGYVGFSVAFAFAIAALLAGRLDATWARWSRPWTTAAWGCLTLGIALGSWWAYRELGWGGWWFWDPVENASLMPWLAGTALMHSLAVTDQRGAFRRWTVLLAIAAFSLSLVGTFLVRSGVLTSVHAFASDPRRGLFVLGLLVVVIGGSLALYAWRAGAMPPNAGGAFAPASRETLLLVNNVLLAVAAATVLLGTVYPLAMQALGLASLSVGPPYFDTVVVPLLLALMALVAAGPVARWKRLDAADLARRLRGPAAAGVLVAAVAPVAAGGWTAKAALGLGLAGWVGAAVAQQAWQRRRTAGTARAWWGMQLAHLGLAVTAAGIALVTGYAEVRDVQMRPGDAVSLAGRQVRFRGVTHATGPNWVAEEARVDLLDGPRLVRTLHPQKRHYLAGGMPTTEAAIATDAGGDWYVSLGEALPTPAEAAGAAIARREGLPPVLPQGWLLRLQRKPFVEWIWAGGLLMALGGAVAATDRRYRLRARAGERRA